MGKAWNVRSCWTGRIARLLPFLPFFSALLFGFMPRGSAAVATVLSPDAILSGVRAIFEPEKATDSLADSVLDFLKSDRKMLKAPEDDEDEEEHAPYSAGASVCQEAPSIEDLPPSLLWRLRQSLQRCGMRRLPDNWPGQMNSSATTTAADNKEQFRRQLASAFEALSEVRSDNVSLVCPRSLVGGYQQAIPPPPSDPTTERNTDFENDDDHTTSSEPASPLLRCPRCGHVVADDPDVQVFLMETRQKLLGDAASLEATTSSVPAPEGCLDKATQTAQELESAWSTGGPSSLLPLAASFPCDGCHRAGLLRFLDAQKARASHVGAGSEDALVFRGFSALASVRCARGATGSALGEAGAVPSLSVGPWPSLEEALNELESIAWTGVGFPLLQELAVEGKLRATSRAPSTSLCSSLSSLGDTSPVFVCESCIFGGEIEGSDLNRLDSNADLDMSSREDDVLAQYRSSSRTPHDALSVALQYADLAGSLESPSRVALSLARGASWLLAAGEGMAARGEATLREKLTDSAVHFAAGAHLMATSGLTPGAELLVLKAMQSVLSKAGKSSTLAPARKRLSMLSRHVAFASPPEVPLRFAPAAMEVANRLHKAAAARLPGRGMIDGSLSLSAYAGTPVRSSKIASTRFDIPSIALDEGRHGSSIRGGAKKHLSFVAIQGVRSHPEVQSAEFFLRRPRIEDLSATASPVLFDKTLLVDLLRAAAASSADASSSSSSSSSSEDDASHSSSSPSSSHSSSSRSLSSSSTAAGNLALALQPTETEANVGGDSLWLWPGRSPWRKLTTSPALRSTPAFVGPLLRAASSVLEGLASSSEADSPTLEIETRPTSKGLEIDFPHFQLLCQDQEVWRTKAVESDGMDEFLFKKPVPKVVSLSESGDETSDLRSRILASELYQKLPRSVREEVETLCTVFAAAKFAEKGWTVSEDSTLGLAGGLGSLSDPAKLLIAVTGHSQEMPAHAREWWLARLAEAHEKVLNSLGYTNLDPGGCWDERFDFGRCCSVGEHSSECWLPGFSQERCCGGLKAEVKPQTEDIALRHLLRFACYQPARPEALRRLVRAWLAAPLGSDDRGRLRSTVLRVGLQEEAPPCGNWTSSSSSSSSRRSSLPVPPTPRPSSSSKRGGPRGKTPNFPTLLAVSPSLPLAKASVLLEPRAKNVGKSGFQRSPWEDEDALTVVSRDELLREASRAELPNNIASLAMLSPRVRTLKRLSTLLQSIERKAAAAAAAAGAPSESEVADRLREECCRQSGETTVGPIENGTSLLVRAVDSPGSSYDEVTALEDVVLNRGSGSKATNLQKISLSKSLSSRLGGPKMAFLDLSSSGSEAVWEYKRGTSPKCRNVICDSHRQADGEGSPGQTFPWPQCVHQGYSLQGSGGAALFVNVQSFGMSTGCFRGDCTHSDHFDSPTPAACARVCASVRACHFWSYWIPSSASREGTCWLRRHDRGVVEMGRSVSGTSECHQKAGPSLSDDAGEAEPTLYDLAKGGHGVGPNHPLHQWDMLPILQRFGKMSPSELEASSHESPLHRSAARFARKALRLRGMPSKKKVA